MVNYLGYCGTPTVDFNTVKILLDIIVSTPNAKFMTTDVKYFHLNTPMARSKYMGLKLSNLPKSVVRQYNLEAKDTKDSYVYVEIKWGLYGLPQAGLIAQQLLDKQLNKKGYRKSDIIQGFWTHDWRLICFLLCVDHFGVKYFGKQHADHLMTVIIDH